MTALGFEITHYVWNDEMVLRRAASGAKDAHESAGERLIELLATVAPLDTGRLIGDATEDHNEDEGTVSYATPYAAILHEHPQWNFQHGREGKWLERTMNANGATVLDEFGDAMKKAL